MMRMVLLSGWKIILNNRASETFRNLERLKPSEDLNFCIVVYKGDNY